jgi:hypothetical protein
LCIDVSSGLRPVDDWKRPPGRPRRTWLKQLEEDSGKTVGALSIFAQDRMAWRSLRPSLVKRSSE